MGLILIVARSPRQGRWSRNSHRISCRTVASQRRTSPGSLLRTHARASLASRGSVATSDVDARSRRCRPASRQSLGSHSCGWRRSNVSSKTARPQRAINTLEAGHQRSLYRRIRVWASAADPVAEDKVRPGRAATIAYARAVSHAEMAATVSGSSAASGALYLCTASFCASSTRGRFSCFST